mmetsp:Transcript_35884/g.61785  ORF Transcript_35884/g.61785 Transcript_35884/m.61785 type:complete len:200 (+) Transcript_35884:858-1457(+)
MISVRRCSPTLWRRFCGAAAGAGTGLVVSKGRALVTSATGEDTAAGEFRESSVWGGDCGAVTGEAVRGVPKPPPSTNLAASWALGLLVSATLSVLEPFGVEPAWAAAPLAPTTGLHTRDSRGAWAVARSPVEVVAFASLEGEVTGVVSSPATLGTAISPLAGEAVSGAGLSDGVPVARTGVWALSTVVRSTNFSDPSLS